MKIQAIELTTKRPLQSQKLQLQVRGKDSGYLTITTDAQGFFELEDKMRGQQIAHLLAGKTGQWITATDGAKLTVESMKSTAGTSGKEKTPMGSGSHHK